MLKQVQQDKTGCNIVFEEIFEKGVRHACFCLSIKINNDRV